jgi:hypothetical protein
MPPLALRSLLVAVLLLATTGARAESGAEASARRLFAEGREAFGHEQHDVALDRFQRAYLLVRSPALLYDMASVLEAAGRPHDAAEKLRAYLRAAPADGEAAVIEARARALDEAQRLLDAQILKAHPPRLLELAPPPRWTRRQTVATVLGVLGGLVAGGVAVGLVLGLRPGYSATTIPTQRVTP